MDVGNQIHGTKHGRVRLLQKRRKRCPKFGDLKKHCSEKNERRKEVMVVSKRGSKMYIVIILAWVCKSYKNIITCGIKKK